MSLMSSVLVKTTLKIYLIFKSKPFTLIAVSNLIIINLNNLFSLHGIFHQFACPHTPEQNGVAERKHYYIVETGLSLMAHSSVPFKYWFESFNIVVYFIKRMPILSSPYEALFHAALDYTHLENFGSACCPWLRSYRSNKLDFKSAQCVFLGYSLQHKGYQCVDPSSGCLYISRHVTFD